MTSLPEGAPSGAVSIDLDSAVTHLAGYHRRPTGRDNLLGLATGRLLRMLSERRMRATFFVVARDVAPNPDWLHEIVSEGHEVGSHSATHPTGLSRLPSIELRRELSDARQAIQDRLGVAVAGFRAPSWDVTPRVLSMAGRFGYAYDASLLPTPLLVPARVMVAIKSGSPLTLLDMPFWPMSLRRMPYSVSTRGGRVIEVPVSVSPRLRWPIYHTLRYGMSDDRFATALDALRRRCEPLSYPLHAIDAVGIDDDGLDASLLRHPGGPVPLDEKLDLLGRTLDGIASRFTSVTLGELSATVPSGGTES